MKGKGESAKAAVFALVVALAATACKAGRRASIDDFKDALARGDASRVVAGLARCEVEAGVRAPDACLAAMATAFGSKTGFHFDPPDEASAATAALVVVREGRGEWVPAPEAWLLTLREGTGPGADALRLAVAGKMAEGAPAFARALGTEEEARALMKAVAASVPGACDTYARLGAGGSVDAPPPQATADHSPCVQKDLERAGGPKAHGRYGYGVWRGAAGALALWKDVAGALRAGEGAAEPAVKGVVEAKLGAIEAALGKVTLKELPPAPDWATSMGGEHDVEDAGPRRR